MAQPEVAVAIVGTVGLISSGFIAGVFNYLTTKVKPTPEPVEKGSAEWVMRSDIARLEDKLEEAKEALIILLERTSRDKGR